MTSFRTSTLLVLSASLLLATVAPAFAGVPRKQPLGRYADLWTKSPFTVPPVVVPDDIPVVNPLEDYTLAGVCEIKGGWFVVLINKKKREERIRIKPGEPNEAGFKVVNVTHGTKYKETKVEIDAGGKKGWVEYDDKFLVLKKATPSAARAKPGARPGKPPVPGRTNPAARPPTPTTAPSSTNRPSRVRRVPTPPTR